ncbi:MAG: ABC transporter permease, partial [Thermoflexus sp.]
MGLFVLRRLGVMLLTALALTFVVFYLTNLQPNLEKLARTEGSVRMTDESVAAWIEQNGHSGSVIARYGQ